MATVIYTLTVIPLAIMIIVVAPPACALVIIVVVRNGSPIYNHALKSFPEKSRGISEDYYDIYLLLVG